MFAVEGTLYILRCELMRSQFHRIHPNAHGIAALSPNLDIRDPRNGLQPFGEYIFGEVAYFQRIAAGAAHRHGDDGIAVGIGLAHHGQSVDVAWQAAHRL